MLKCNPNLPLISLHLPRTGGTSFRVALREWFGPNLFLHYKCPNGMPLKVPFTGPICIHGHFHNYSGTGVDDYYPQARQFTAFFREPFDRFISSWFFQNKRLSMGHKSRVQEGMKFRDYLEKVIVYSYRRGTNSLILRFMPKIMNPSNYNDVFDEFFIFVGVQERMQLNANQFANCIGVSTIQLPHRNESTRLNDELDDNFTNYFEIYKNFFSIDYEIYQAVLRRVETVTNFATNSRICPCKPDIFYCLHSERAV